jgi:hypothetical protein
MPNYAFFRHDRLINAVVVSHTVWSVLIVAVPRLNWSFGVSDLIAPR